VASLLDDRPPESGPPPPTEAPPAPPPPPTRTVDRYRERSAWAPLLPVGLLLLLLLLAGAWLAGLGPFAGRQPSGSGFIGGGATSSPSPTNPFLPTYTSQPTQPAQPTEVPPGLTAPPVGLTVLSPQDGALVGSKQITVIGSAPAGLTITQDISFGIDRHATVDGTGHWAIQADLAEGENKLVFRIGDDQSTKQTLRVIYVPQATP
jgi:hypothetical protein